ncbi:Protein kinase-like domain [Coniochaeta hoffmannii]|uniref:non-specific serine/threonine protein kinase n=1 Tax=Coniochaeta hoffmannii TaxID=91930 RepID=A0AA38SH33_9PEZI|nr:Protein kinase-like domain [Coniochaeta hoffmannii]
MSRPVRKYGKARTKPIISERLFAELPTSPAKNNTKPGSTISELTEKLVAITLDDHQSDQENETPDVKSPIPISEKAIEPEDQLDEPVSIVDDSTTKDDDYRILTWDDVCPFGDRIEKIAEASYAEVYRVTNARGTSIIKVIRLQSPIKPQTKAQQNSGLVDEEPHSEDDLAGELRISEWLADIPGFVVYKERYIVQGKATKALLETHQSFHRKAKRRDPDRLQFYPSPSRYLDNTRFLVVELGDAGTALEDFPLESTTQIWDILFHTAIALARAEDLAKFEHRDLHEGNLCVRQTGPPTAKSEDGEPCQFGYSGLDITILDYGLSRAEEDDGEAVAYDLEKDLGIFTSTHAPQCRVYRQMRSFLLKGDRVCLPAKAHDRAYDVGFDGERIDWTRWYPYTNVLWLAYIYQYMVDNFTGEKKSLTRFKRDTREMWLHLNPDAPRTVLSFSSAGDVVRFAVECGWIKEEQLVGDGSFVDGVSVAGIESIIEVSTMQDVHLRRSPRRRRRAVY